MDDYVVRTIAESGQVRGLACVTTNLVQQACKLHRTSPVASVAFARTLTGAALMGMLMDRDERVSVKFQGNGPIEKVIVEANGRGQVRGYVDNPLIDVPLVDGHIKVSDAFGSAGLVTVSKDINMKEPYTGTVHMVSGEVGDDLAYYFTESEQIPSAFGLGAYIEKSGIITAAGGFLIQTMPPSNPANIESIIHMIHSIPSLTNLFREGKTPEDILSLIFAEVPYHILATEPLSYTCYCSKDYFARALKKLGNEALQELSSDGKDNEIICDFCKSRYVFTYEDIEELFD